MKRQLITQLHAEHCSCIVYNNNTLRSFHERGVKDLYNLLTLEPEALKGAMIADKVVGKGAAALMIAGGAAWVYTDIVSHAAMELFRKSYVEVEFKELVPNIINRSGDDICPVEKLCRHCESAEECLPLIDKFVKEMSR